MWGLGFMFHGLWFIVYGLRFMVCGLWSLVYVFFGLCFMVHGVWLMVYCLSGCGPTAFAFSPPCGCVTMTWCGVWGLRFGVNGFRVSDFGFQRFQGI